MTEITEMQSTGFVNVGIKYCFHESHHVSTTERS